MMTWVSHERRWYSSSSLLRRNSSFSVILLSYLCMSEAFSILSKSESGGFITHVQVCALRWLNVDRLPLCILLLMSVMNVKGYSLLNKLFNSVRCVIVCMTERDERVCVQVELTMWEPTRKYETTERWRAIAIEKMKITGWKWITYCVYGGNLGGGMKMWGRLFTAVDYAVSACYSCIQYLDFFSLPAIFQVRWLSCHGKEESLRARE